MKKLKTKMLVGPLLEKTVIPITEVTLPRDRVIVDYLRDEHGFVLGGGYNFIFRNYVNDRLYENMFFISKEALIDSPNILQHCLQKYLDSLLKRRLEHLSNQDNNENT